MLNCECVLVHQLGGADVDGVPAVAERHAPFWPVPVETQTGWLRVKTLQAGYCRGPGQRNLLTVDGNYH